MPVNQQKIICHAFTTKYNALSNGILTDVKISAPNDSIDNNLKSFKALWDTGATATVIDRNVAQICGLEPTGMTIVHHAKGKSRTNTYIINVYLPNMVCFENVIVTEGELGMHVDALIGMDIISQGDFAITNYLGRTICTFRIPSVESIDFVDLINKQKTYNQQYVQKNFSEISRNARCPCGSGKKFKNCCGK